MPSTHTDDLVRVGSFADFGILLTMRLRSAFTEFTNECRYGVTIWKRRPATIENYVKTVQLLLRWFPLEHTTDINSAVIKRFIKKGEIERRWSDVSIASYCRHLRPFVKWCREKGYLADDPFKDIAMPSKGTVLPEIYSEADVEKILYAIDVYSHTEFIQIRDRAIVAMLQMTGIRKGELLGLKDESIDFLNQTIRIRGETSKAGNDRPVMMTNKLREVLQKYAIARRALQIETPFFWVSEKTRKRFTRHGLKRRFDNLSRISGVRVRAHKFRHTFATETYGATKDIASIQQVLGHKQITTTMIYTQVKPEHTKLTMELNPMNDLF